MGYLGKLLPKFLLPVAGKPLIWYALSALSSVGVTRVTIVVRQKAQLVRGYLEEANVEELDLGEIRVRSLDRPTRNPVETLLRVVPVNPPNLAVTEGDSFTHASDLTGMRELFDRLEPRVLQLTVEDMEKESIRRACEVVPDLGHLIRAIHEKPRNPRSHLRGCGLYLFQGHTFHSLVRKTKSRTNLVCLPDLVATAVLDKSAAFFETRGRNINVNTLADLKEAWSVVENVEHMPL
jgi:NDP-sugar pyrophosphorylase family protein